MDNRLIVSPSPHVHGTESTQRVMIDVLIALAPALIVSTLVFGWMVLFYTAVSVASCVLFEYLIQRYLIKGTLTVNNYSAVVTGVLLAFNMPMLGSNWWIIIIGALVAIGVGKMTFGGLGKNPFNPALVGRVFLLLSFPVAMTVFPNVDHSLVSDSVTSATPLSAMQAAMATGKPLSEAMAMFTWQDMLLGLKNGSFGEVSALALLLGGIYLLYRKVITWHIPVAVLGSMAIFAAILWGINPDGYMSPVFHVLTGGAILGAVFMATDYSTSPMTPKGMMLFGAGIGIITILIRNWGAYPEGMSFAILIMNAFVPLIDKYITPKRFGAAKKARK